MATYKLIQDIEAEDHVIGPLSFRQFVFALIAVFFGYLTFTVITRHVAVLALVFAPPALFFGFFALPFGRDQPTEIWALAKIRFLFKPRKRVWDQSGQKDLVTINVPKKEEHIYTDGLSNDEVRSRLNALANTLDSRGWAVKNIDGQQPNIVTNSDRLVGLNTELQDVPEVDIRPKDDVLDSQSNPIARQFDDMIDASTKAHRQELMDRLENIKSSQNDSLNNQAEVGHYQPNNDWFTPDTNNTQQFGGDPTLQQNYAPQTNNSQVTSENDQAFIDQLQLEASMVQQARTNNAQFDRSPAEVQPEIPINTQLPVNQAQQTAEPYQTAKNPDILSLARNDDLDVATLARQVNKNNGSANEVIVSLH